MSQFDEFNTVSLILPDIVVKDITNAKIEFNTLVSSGKLGDLALAYNKHLLPTVLCPWGCNEYIHKSERFPIDIIFQRYFRKIELLKIFTSKDEKNCGIKAPFESIISARDDYIRPNSNSCDCFLYNRNWTVMPSIVIDNGCPFFLLCRYHKNGTKKKYIHMPRYPKSKLSSKHSDQICHAVIKTRSLKPMKKGYFSNTYQMHEQRGSFQGIDTCNVTKYGNFNHNSYLLHESELLYIANRPDIISLLNDLADIKKISKLYKDSLIEKAMKNNLHKTELISYLNGSTYISLNDSMKLQKIISDAEKTKIKITIVHSNDDDDDQREDSIGMYNVMI